MSGTSFSPEDRAKIMQNKNVLRVGEGAITCSPAFKVAAVRAYLMEGKTPQLIFLDAGFDLDLIGHETPQYCLQRWRAVFKQRGEQGLRDDQHGKNGTGQPDERELTVEEKLRRAEARNRYLEKENELLKKLDAIERSWSATQRRSTR
jgi:transposase-like protein